MEGVEALKRPYTTSTACSLTFFFFAIINLLLVGGQGTPCIAIKYWLFRKCINSFFFMCVCALAAMTSLHGAVRAVLVCMCVCRK